MSAGYDQDPPHEQEERLALLAGFCHQLGKSPDAPVAGNVLRGFLIHNGAFIQGPVWKGVKVRDEGGIPAIASSAAAAEGICPVSYSPSYLKETFSFAR